MANAPPSRHERGDDRPVIIGYDGGPASEEALRQTAALLDSRPALVVVVWEPGLAFDMFPPNPMPAPIDIRAALQVDETVYEGARRLAEKGAALARDAGLKAEGLAVADDITVAETLLRLAQERNACAVAVGTRGHQGLRELLLGSTTRHLIHHALCPVIVTRAPETGGADA